MRGRVLRRTLRGDNGFTLIELLLAVVILGVITIPLSNVVIDFLRHTDATTGKLIESHDVQITSSYWTPDVASIGVRSKTSFELTQSVQADVAYSSGLYPCGSAETPETPETPKAIVRLAWDDYSAPEADATIVRVAYVAQVAPKGTKVTELRRILCKGPAAHPASFDVVSDIPVAHDLDPDNLPTATCSIAGVQQECNAPAVPTTVTLKLTLKDAKDLDAAYQIDLTGQRRQS